MSINPLYLLDTNILSAIIRQPAGAVVSRLAQVGEASICTSIIVACELRFGGEKKQSPLLVQKINDLLQRLEVLTLDPPVDVHYAQIRQYLETQGTPIGPNDLLIAAQTRALDMILVTDNTQEFSRVPGLKVENWINE